MGFRRDSSRHYLWKEWVADHQSGLLAAGVPDWILSDELRWCRFLEEGCDYASGWSPEMLEHSKVCQLHTFIQREYGDKDYRGLLHQLEMYLGRDRKT